MMKINLLLILIVSSCMNMDQIESKEYKLEQLMQSEQKEMELNSIIQNNIKPKNDLLDQLDQDLGINIHNDKQIRFRKTIRHKPNHMMKGVHRMGRHRVNPQKRLTNRRPNDRNIRKIVQNMVDRRQNRMKRQNRMNEQKRMKARLHNKMKLQIKKKLLNKMMISQFKKQIQMKMKRQFRNRVKRMKQKMEYQVEQNYKRRMRIQGLQRMMKQNREKNDRFNIPLKDQKSRFNINSELSDIDKYVIDQQNKYDEKRKNELDQEYKQYQKEYNGLVNQSGLQMRFRKKNRRDQLSRRQNEKDRLINELQKSGSGIMQQMGDILKNHKSMTMNRRRLESDNVDQNNELSMGHYDNHNQKKYQTELEEGLSIFRKRLHNNMNRMQSRLSKHRL